SYLCQALAGEIFRSAGVPAPRTTFAQLFCNGQNLGLYVIVQAITKQFLSQYFTNSDGNLYEGSNHDVNEKLEVDSGDSAGDQVDLKALASALKIPDLSLRFKKLGALLDVDRFITFAAVEVLAVHRDGYSLDRNNFRIYHDPGTGLMTFIPHGYDQLFQQPNRPLLKTNQWSGRVAHGLFQTPEGARLYRQKLRNLLDGPFRFEVINSRLERLISIIHPAATTAPNNELDFESAARQLGANVRKRITYAREALAKMETEAAEGE
ncbi:MAG TPA: CotH kinase family protein, partial [Candidatus Saccharimonadales bacterium]|nr:CotH kinase family protein [Candidatus Saccharimonadales bacterium]